LKGNTLFGNQKKLLDTLSGDERRTYYRLLATNFFSVLLELLGLVIIYLVLILVLSPSQFKEVVQSLAFSPDIRFSTFLTGLFVLFVVKTVTALALQKVQLKQLFAITASLSDRVFSQSFTASLDAHKKVKSADRLSDMNTVTNSLPCLVIIPAVSALSEMVFVTLTVFILFTLKPLLVVILILALLPQTLLLIYWGRKKLSNTGELINKQLATQNELVSSSVFGFAEVNLFNLSGQYKSELNRVRGVIYENRSKVQLYSSIAPQRLMELLTVVALCAIAVYVYKFNHSQGLFNTLALFAAAAFRLLPSLNRIVTGTNTLNSFSAILDLIPSLDTKINHEVTHDIEIFKSLTINELTFGFKNEDALFKNLHLQINKGDFVGLYGESGAGKTTLINIILGFYALPNQAIKVNNYDMHHVTRSWQDKLGYVKQDSYVVSRSIKKNVAFGDTEVDENRVKDLLKKVKLWDWVESLPNQMETNIGENGALISGGQKQRIALARALYRNVEFLVCDEITNSLDEENSIGIWKLLGEINSTGTTILLVSHDKQAFNYTQKVYELAGGLLINHTD
jgi:ABC-type multidrug transport system fused ATPase/permease subunit